MFDFHGDVGDFVYKKPQSKFKGSKRSYRGALLKALVKSKTLSLKEAEDFFADSHYDGKTSVRELVGEGMLCLRNKKITLAE
jgi:hypothetical protein